MNSEAVSLTNRRWWGRWVEFAYLGSGTGGSRVGEVVVGGSGGGDVALGGGDADAEEVAEVAWVAGGEGFVEDAVLADGAGWRADLEGDPVGGGGSGSSGGAFVDKQVWVDAVGPAAVSFGEPGGEAGADGVCEEMVVVADVEVVAVEIDELQVGDVGGSQCVEGDQRGERGSDGVGAVQRGADRVEFGGCGCVGGRELTESGGGVDEDQLAGFEVAEQASQGGDRRALVVVGVERGGDVVAGDLAQRVGGRRRPRRGWSARRW